MLMPFQWIGLYATVTVFAVMFALGLMLGREDAVSRTKIGNPTDPVDLRQSGEVPIT